MPIDQQDRDIIVNALRGKKWLALTALRTLTGWSSNASPSLRTAVLQLQAEGVVVTTAEWEAPFCVAIRAEVE